ncbi:MAG: thymidine phosphorylase [Planctomycetaceae bacterium]|nr:thymidine phosphorylase [Planctomycetaceae bacterium]
MNPVWIIAKKRDGGELTAEEIGFFLAGYVEGDIPAYQMSALSMAIYLRGMNVAETAALTDHMLASGVTLEWSAGGLPKVDKHSTGGIGDKVSLPLSVMLACCDVQVPMISGRGLGSTGGTLDKLEAISGFRTDLSTQEMRTVVERVGCAINGATPELVPADRKLYALRDVTATVPSIPLITASIMSKKLAENLNALVLDVKFGSGAFMKTKDSALQLAESLVHTGKRMGVATTALLTDMNQPLGRMVGNAVEVTEALGALEGKGPADLMEVTLSLGAELLLSAGIAGTLDEAKNRLQQTIDKGSARERFEQMVAAQGGDLGLPLRIAPAHEVVASRAGFVAGINAEELGQAVIAMHGGRQKIDDVLDHSTGIEMLVRLGDQVILGQPLAKLYAPQDSVEAGRHCLRRAIEINDTCTPPGLIIAQRVT